MKTGLLLGGVLVAAVTYFGLPMIPGLPSYAPYIGYGLAAILVLFGVLGKKRLY